MRRSYRIAILGIGAVANVHAQAINQIPDANLAAGTCTTKSKGNEFATRFDCEWYSDNEMIFIEEEPDIAIVCTPSGVHDEAVELAAEYGVHVLCEKPLHITCEQIDRMIDLADDAGIRFGGVFQRRYKPAIQRARIAIESGRLGNLATMSVYNPRWRDDEYYGPDRWQGTAAIDGGGALINQTIHGIDQIQWLAQASMPSLDPSINPVETVFAFTDTLAHADDLLEVEDTAVAVMRFRNGLLGHVHAATSAYPGSDKRIHLAGRDGTIEIHGDDISTWELRDESGDDNGETFSTGSTNESEDPTGINHEPFVRNIREFLCSIETDNPFLIEASEARKAVEIVEAIYRSAEIGEPVTIPA